MNTNSIDFKELLRGFTRTGKSKLFADNPIQGGWFTGDDAKQYWYSYQESDIISTHITYWPSYDHPTRTVEHLRHRLQPMTHKEATYCCHLMSRAGNISLLSPKGYQGGFFQWSGEYFEFVAYQESGIKIHLAYPHLWQLGNHTLRSSYLTTMHHAAAHERHNSVSHHAWHTVVQRLITSADSRVYFLGDTVPMHTLLTHSSFIFDTAQYVQDGATVEDALLQSRSDYKKLRKYKGSSDFKRCVLISSDRDSNDDGFKTFDTGFTQRCVDTIPEVSVTDPTIEMFPDAVIDTLFVLAEQSSQPLLIAYGLHGEPDGSAKYGSYDRNSKHFWRLSKLAAKYSHVTIVGCSCRNKGKYGHIKGNILLNSSAQPAYDKYVQHLIHFLKQDYSLIQAHLLTGGKYSESLIRQSISI